MAKKKKKKKHSFLRGFIKFQIVILLLVLAGVTYFYVGGYASKISRLHDEAISFVNKSDESTFRQTETSIAFDANGNVLSILKGEKDLYYLSYADIPIYVKEAIISIEDKKFYDHSGVDYMAIMRAFWAMIRNRRITEGASTITQQLARTIFLTQDRTWERKIEEIYIALEMEKRYSKNQILEFYLNNIYFANGFYGIEAASRGYFDKSCQDLSLSQIAYLLAIPNSPTELDPIVNPNGTYSRRNLILRNMYDDGIISLQEYQNALKENIIITPASKVKHDYQETFIFYCATRALMQMEGFEFRYEFEDDTDKKRYQNLYSEMYDECNSKLFRGGYRIYTSLDSDMQQSLQEILNARLEFNTETNEEGIYALQGSAVCMDNETGLVKAIVGGRSQDYDGYTLNRAYQSFRQPGSAIKPLVVYTPALERGYTPDSILVDEPFEGGPNNSDGTFLGNITLRNAVELSRNTTAWKVLEDITPSAGLSYLKTMNFSQIVPSDNVPAAALGGFTNGVSALEMARAYCALENEGYFRDSTCITKITNSKGETIFQPDMTRIVVYKENAARQMTDILQGVFTRGTARGLGIPNMNCAGKTGTTNDNKDGWFCGYTPYYTTAVWVGFDNPRELPGLFGSTMPGEIWQDFMVGIHAGLENKPFHTSVVDYTQPQPQDELTYTLPENNPVSPEAATPEPEPEAEPNLVPMPQQPQQQQPVTPEIPDFWQIPQQNEGNTEQPFYNENENFFVP